MRFSAITAVIILASFLPIGARALVPDGSLLQGSGPRVYAVERGERRWIQSERDFLGLGYRWNMIRRVGDEELLRYPRGSTVMFEGGYPDYTLVKGSRPPVYMILNGERRWARSIAVVTGSGLTLANLLRIPDGSLSTITEGSPLASPLSPPPETEITVGPEDGSSTERTDIIFGFRGRDAHGSTTVTFETKVEGFDSNWIDVGAQVERSVTLPPIPFPYVFFVRAKDRAGIVDRTPARRLFLIGHSSASGSVKIESVTSGTEVPGTEYVTVRVTGEEAVNFSGWRIANDRGASYEIGRAVDDYVRGGTFNQLLIVPPNGIVVVASGRSVLGSNFRVNRCMGFLERLGSFLPQFSGQCPTPSDAVINNFSTACRTYLRGLSSCSAPEPLPIAEQNRLGKTCVEFALNRWNYNSCREDHRSEPGFFTDEWRVFFNLTEQFLRDDHDTIILRDATGKVVDQYRY